MKIGYIRVSSFDQNTIWQEVMMQEFIFLAIITFYGYISGNAKISCIV